MDHRYIDHRYVEDEATKLITDWLIDERPRLGESLWGASGGNLEVLSELVQERILDDGRNAEPAGERVYFGLQDLSPGGQTAKWIKWERVTGEMRKVFQAEPNQTNRNRSRRKR